MARQSGQIADYIADMCAEMVTMAQAADLKFLAHLLTMAQAEAENAGEHVIRPRETPSRAP